jgi:hypothetical protein
VPSGFLEGVISSLTNPSDPTSPANYRPITLLDTDYRTLARVLARRLLPVFGAAIDPAQTAFLSSRRIADNVWLLQLLPELLRVDWRSALAVFLDFYKAYDTVDRTLPDGLPGSPGGWPRLPAVGGAAPYWHGRDSTGQRPPLPAGAHHVGHPAGVPPGVAPLLYLALGQALLAWLKSRGVGLPLGARHVTASQYADDCTPFLDGPGALHPFMAAMDVFRLASGQRLNP